MRRPLLSLLPVALLSACAPQYPAEGARSQTQAPATTSMAPAAADVVPLTSAQEQAIRAVLATNLKGVPIDAVRASSMPGVVEIKSGMNFGYVSADGRYLIEGDLNDLSTHTRITEESRKVARAALLSTVPADQSIEFAPKDGKAKYEVTVFTDVDCGYCRMLHKQIAQYNAEGIAVRYLFFPRSGLNTESFYKAEEVWCSADRQKALTEAKLGEPLSADKSCPNPVAAHLNLAAELGLRGTPAIFLSDGEMIPGYKSPEDLLQVLAEHEAHPTASLEAPGAG